jgi:hypothetical protein
MHTTSLGASGRYHTRAQIEAAIVRAEIELTHKLDHLERRRAAGRDCTIAERVVRSIQTRLDTLHLHRDTILQAEAAGEA